MPFKVGDRVTWETRVFTMTGTVRIVVPPGVTPATAVIPLGMRIAFIRCRFTSNKPRAHESYLVEVNDGPMPELYWPRVWQLKRVEST